jgi:hypothetical protein
MPAAKNNIAACLFLIFRPPLSARSPAFIMIQLPDPVNALPFASKNFVCYDWTGIAGIGWFSSPSVNSNPFQEEANERKSCHRGDGADAL